VVALYYSSSHHGCHWWCQNPCPWQWWTAKKLQRRRCHRPLRRPHRPLYPQRWLRRACDAWLEMTTMMPVAVAAIWLRYVPLTPRALVWTMKMPCASNGSVDPAAALVSHQRNMISCTVKAGDVVDAKSEKREIARKRFKCLCESFFRAVPSLWYINCKSRGAVRTLQHSLCALVTVES
jgi:hypothetical protein